MSNHVSRKETRIDMRSLAIAMIALLGFPAFAQVTDVMDMEKYKPNSSLVVPKHELTRSKYPFIDVHAHQRRNLSTQQVDELIVAMDAMNMRVMVNLSGGAGASFRQAADTFLSRHKGRFVVFANVDLEPIDEPDFAEKATKQLEADVKAGASGLKIYKNLGMFLRDKSGKRVPTDDARLDPIWETCARLGIPVLIHTGEPSPFWQPWDEHNERWLELKQRPNRRRDDPARFASFEETMAEQQNLFRKHPKTTFIMAHLGWYGNDLQRLGKLLDELPNVYTEIGAVLAELGRQPRAANAFLVKYQDRVMFGKDSWAPSEYHVYFRTLETADEYFDYYRPRHAHWKIYGIDLPDSVLKKIYYKNALRVIPGIDASRFPE